MPNDVMDSLKHVCISAGGLNESDSAQYINAMESKKRLQLETWA